MCPSLVRDYDLVVGDETVCRVRDTARRFRRHDFATVQAENLRLVVYRTWGGPRAEVFDLRTYGPPEEATK